MHTFILYITTCYDLLWALTCNVCCYRHVKPLSFILKGISHNQSWSKYLPWHVHFRCTSLDVHILGYTWTSWTQTPYRLPKKTDRNCMYLTFCMGKQPISKAHNDLQRPWQCYVVDSWGSNFLESEYFLNKRLIVHPKCNP